MTLKLNGWRPQEQEKGGCFHIPGNRETRRKGRPLREKAGTKHPAPERRPPLRKKFRGGANSAAMLVQTGAPVSRPEDGRTGPGQWLDGAETRQTPTAIRSKGQLQLLHTQEKERAPGQMRRMRGAQLPRQERKELRNMPRKAPSGNERDGVRRGRLQKRKARVLGAAMGATGAPHPGGAVEDSPSPTVGRRHTENRGRARKGTETTSPSKRYTRRVDTGNRTVRRNKPQAADAGRRGAEEAQKTEK